MILIFVPKILVIAIQDVYILLFLIALLTKTKNKKYSLVKKKKKK
jgi:hypothetical protein